MATSNKALVAKHGAELLEIAREREINFMFEASVGGGIPIIRALNSSLTADRIDEVIGILNGTTNYMMIKMFFEGADYAEVLKEAQDKGYAERNPEADVEGHDACRKIAILTSLISGQHVDFEKIHTEGITKITTEDMKYAKTMDMAIKLGKPVNPKLHVGICGEHGGDPSSVEFCHKIGLDYVSCSPFRVPIARLAAAQAAIANK